MARERFLCLATGIDRHGQRRTFKVYKSRGQHFVIYNDRGHSTPSHGSCRVTADDIRGEIITVYDVGDVRLEGSVEEGVRAATWPQKYEQCANCGCPPTFRFHG